MTFTIIEKLTLNLSPSYDAIVRYGGKVCVTRLNYKGKYEAEIYGTCIPTSCVLNYLYQVSLRLDSSFCFLSMVGGPSLFYQKEDIFSTHS